MCSLLFFFEFVYFSHREQFELFMRSTNSFEKCCLFAKRELKISKNLDYLYDISRLFWKLYNFYLTKRKICKYLGSYIVREYRGWILRSIASFPQSYSKIKKNLSIFSNKPNFIVKIIILFLKTKFNSNGSTYLSWQLSSQK